jgi:hypothetical protein
MSKAPADRVLAAIDSLRGTVTMARVLVQSGRTVDLAGLDAEAATLCQQVTKLPNALGRRLRPALEALVLDIEGLAATLPFPDGPRDRR